ncbi:hypothetical protein AJ78_08369 [Emergomyces pasteurianus Ep9510]|uniref:catalase n=1 Tax=Emergomyces pasteurianus Ep9510 TaxID=1447872 RepID=A0A1J9P1N9_9EURO|nr:hypothetical protein AJ78_08369 [Emergomyces pasteurianus Ep9510]
MHSGGNDCLIVVPQFQPAHLVRGIDFTEDPLLQGRLYSYLDTQLNRNNGPNFEQLPINQPRIPIHNHNRDGYGQSMIHQNKVHYSPSALTQDGPKQANQTNGKGFITAPNRKARGPLTRERSPTFEDVWSQPRLFYNSLTITEQQIVINAIRFETSGVESELVRQNVITQLNRIDHDLAVRVAQGIGVDAPQPDPTYYHNNKTVPLGTLGTQLLKLDGLRVALLTSGDLDTSVKTASSLKATFNKLERNVDVLIVGPVYDPKNGLTATYAAADGALVDGVIIVDSLLTSVTTLYPPGRPTRVAVDAYRYGKPVAAVGSGSEQAITTVLSAVDGASQSLEQPGVYVSQSVNDDFVMKFLDGLRQNRFLDRFKMDSDA